MAETEYLNSIPGMAESILEGMQEPLENCVPEEEIEEIFSSGSCQMYEPVIK